MNKREQIILNVIKDNKYVFVTHVKNDGVMYEFPYDCSNYKFEQECNELSINNCIFDKTETINISSIDHVTVYTPPSGDDTQDVEQWNERQIDTLKTLPGWDRSLWSSDSGAIPEDILDTYRLKYFSCCDMNCRIRPEEAFLLCKLEIDSIKSLKSIEIDSLKEKWKNLIHESKLKAEKVLQNEKDIAIKDKAFEDVEEIDIIFSLLDEVMSDVDENLSQIDNVNDVLSYWPPLLLPSPVFVQLIDF